MKNIITVLLLVVLTQATFSQTFEKKVNQEAKAIEADMIKWRRHLHQYPELSNREYKTAKYIEDHVRKLGLKVETGVALTGVVAVLETGRPGPVIGLRADMDGLPVKERVPLAFASKEEGEFRGDKVPVMHACGHDTHVAILMATASVLTKMKSDLKGKIIFVFQPAEEGAPPGEEGGAFLMIKEGMMKKHGIEVMFGLHISSNVDVNTITYKTGGTMAAVDNLEIKVKGKQTHGSKPWGGIDPIVISAQIIMGLQTIVSRQLDLTNEAAVVTIGKIQGGVRNNIIPEEVNMLGTIRSLDTAMQTQIHEKIRRTVDFIAKSGGAEAEVSIIRGYPITRNDKVLVGKMLGTLERVAGDANVRVVPASTGAEDFSFFAEKVPGFFFFLGGKPLNVPVLESSQHHTPDFFIDESGLLLGVKSMCNLVYDYGMK